VSKALEAAQAARRRVRAAAYRVGELELGLADPGQRFGALAKADDELDRAAILLAAALSALKAEQIQDGGMLL
jgi:hypothetical protein